MPSHPTVTGDTCVHVWQFVVVNGEPVHRGRSPWRHTLKAFKTQSGIKLNMFTLLSPFKLFGHSKINTNLLTGAWYSPQTLNDSPNAHQA